MADEQEGAAAAESGGLKREVLYAETRALRELCENNGIPEEQFVHRAHLTQHLDLFMGQWGTSEMSFLRQFTGLTSLCIMKQENLTAIEGLDLCVNLESLWITECRVGKIAGLASCTHLKNLHLSSNQLSTIEGLSTLTGLELLWLNDNSIRRADGLESLTNLRVLWLCRNRVTEIGPALMHNQRLEELNLAHNRISSFRDILNLARLGSLKSLSFSDPHFGDNPICKLCNYQTYVTYHLTQLASLDMEHISDDAKRLARAIYLKKKMYYNMRMKTLKRDATNIITKAQEMHQSKMKGFDDCVRTLLRLQKDMQCCQLRHAEAEAREAGQDEQPSPARGGDDETPPADFLASDASTLLAAIESLQGHISAIEQLLEILRQRILEISVFSTSRVMVEFDTGGNVRLEEGKPSDLWFRSCAELVNSRFLAHDFQGLGISGIRVNRVIRVHNRYLRSRFDKHMQHFMDKKDRKDDAAEGSKRAFEYLFYGESPLLAAKTGCRNELLRVAEEGFRAPDEYRRHGFDGAVRLASCVHTADSDRIESIHPRGAPRDSLTLGRALSLCHGQLVITKAFLGNHREIVEGEHEHVHAADFPDHDSVYVSRGPNPKNKGWFVFDDALLLPEYVVSFQYLSDDDDHASSISSFQKEIVEFGGIGGKEQLSDQELLDYTPFLLPLIYFLRQVDSSCLAHERDHGDLYSQAKGVSRRLPERPKLVHITESAALAAANTGAESFADITHLNLHGNGIRKIEKISACPNLQSLVLSSNEIHRIEGLSTLHKLEHLDLSFNMLKRIGSLNGLHSLITLNLANNLLSKLEDVNSIRRHVPGLAHLDLRGNVICKARAHATQRARPRPRSHPARLFLLPPRGYAEQELSERGAAQHREPATTGRRGDCGRGESADEDVLSRPHPRSHSLLWHVRRVRLRERERGRGRVRQRERSRARRRARTHRDPRGELRGPHAPSESRVARLAAAGVVRAQRPPEHRWARDVHGARGAQPRGQSTHVAGKHAVPHDAQEARLEPQRAVGAAQPRAAHAPHTALAREQHDQQPRRPRAPLESYGAVHRQ